jgi:hypothetical protein
LVERPLHSARAGPKRNRQGCARPRLTIGEEGKHRGMLFVDERRQDNDLACAVRGQSKTLLRCANICQRSKFCSKSSDFDPQPCAMRFIGMLCPEGACEKRASLHVAGPGFTQCARKREQYRARCKQDRQPCIPHDVSACVDDEYLGRQERFDLLKR